MRQIFAILLLAGLPACTLLQPEKVILSGSTWLVPQAGVHEAIAVARAGNLRFALATLDGVVVDSRSQLYIYFSGPDLHACAIVRRVDGQWRYVGAEINCVIVT